MIRGGVRRLSSLLPISAWRRDLLKITTKKRENFQFCTYDGGDALDLAVQSSK